MAIGGNEIHATISREVEPVEHMRFLHPRTTSFSMLYFRFHAHECMHPLLSLFSSPALSACLLPPKTAVYNFIGPKEGGTEVGKNPAR